MVKNGFYEINQTQKFLCAQYGYGSTNLSNYYFQAILSNIKSEKILFLEEIIFFYPNLVSTNKSEASKKKPALNFQKWMVLLILEIYRNMIFMSQIASSNLDENFNKND